MKIQISGYRGEGKSTLINILIKVLENLGYKIYKKQLDIDISKLKGIKEKIIIEELFSTSTNNKEKEN